MKRKMFIYLFLIVISLQIRTPPNELIRHLLKFASQNPNDFNNTLNYFYYPKPNRKGVPLDYYSNFSIPEGNATHYQLRKQIGRGKYSKVYKGKNIITGDDVIIKVLKPSNIILLLNIIYIYNKFI